MGSGRWRVLLLLYIFSFVAFFNKADAAPPGPFDLTPDTRPAESQPQTQPWQTLRQAQSQPATSTILPPAAHASDSAAEIYWRKNDASSRPAPAIGPPTFFQRKDWEFGIGIQGFTAHHTRDDSIAFGTLDLSYFIAKNLSIGLEAGLAPGTSSAANNTTNSTGSEDDDDDSGDFRPRASEGQALARYHLFGDSRLSLYVDAGIGYLHATRYFPTYGRSDNWLVSAGLGVDLRIVDGFYFHAGARVARLSGGDLFAGRNTRDASDGVQYYGGFSVEC
jgi:opacity protein-like surface antigen